MKIVGVKHNSKGDIIEYHMDNGKVLTKWEAIKFATDGKIEGVDVIRSDDHTYYLRSLPDSTVDNNLINLPEME
ncbi:MAG: DUF3892 domain-containing protein [Clostridium sp.]|uniref:DUF3892 domain-containing protein n=1 Tax=Clostridium sp. TaxID=1506 RepID=UPI002FCB3C01